MSDAPDIKEIFERYRLPNFDVDAFVESRKADIDAVSRATSAAFAGASEVAAKQTELLKTTLGQMGDAMKSFPNDAKQPGDLMSKQRDLVQNTLTKTLESMRDMAQATQKTQAEIYETATERVRANVAQLRDLFNRE